MTNWKSLLEIALSDYDESWADIESSTLSTDDLIRNFDDGYGWINGCPFTLWTKNSVYFPVCYDGSEWVGRVSRNPDGQPTEHQGGG